jgi:predicted RNA binding protein YcfA (HicA-like mRNA interferase family)
MPVSGKDAVRILEKAGFVLAHVTGSHHIMKHPDGRWTSVPVHGNKDLKAGTQRNIERNAGFKLK